MKSSVIVTLMITFVVIGFNGCTVTSHYKVNSNLEFEQVPKNERKTYIVFGKEQLIKEVKKENEFSDESFENEFVTKKEEADPFEGYNRMMTSVNDYLYINLLTPVAKGYAKVVPQDGRIAISNFFENITFPIRFINNILQFKFYNAFEETERFVINSTFGILGLLDPATEHLHIDKHDEDFGQTLGYYGFKGGYHIVLPLYGPSNVRDIIGMAANGYINPLNDMGDGDIKYKIPERFEQTMAIQGFDAVNKTSLNLGKYENLKKDAIDLYPFLKDIYNQNREKMIKE